MFGEPQTLIVVYDDELLLNQLKKLVETKDDDDEENIKGTRDGSVRIVAWTEKVWMDQKVAGNINNKVLFLGNIKGVKTLAPVADIKYDKYGIRYGWAGNQAIILCDRMKIKDAKDYNAFLDDFNKLNVPAELHSEARQVREKVEKTEEKKNFFKKIGGVIGKAAKTVNDSITVTSKKVVRQQYIFGLHQFYENHLQEFLDS